MSKRINAVDLKSKHWRRDLYTALAAEHREEAARFHCDMLRSQWIAAAERFEAKALAADAERLAADVTRSNSGGL